MNEHDVTLWVGYPGTFEAEQIEQHSIAGENDRDLIATALMRCGLYGMNYERHQDGERIILVLRDDMHLTID